MTIPIPEPITADLPVIIEDLLNQAAALSSEGADTAVDERLDQVADLRAGG